MLSMLLVHSEKYFFKWGRNRPSFERQKKYRTKKHDYSFARKFKQPLYFRKRIKIRYFSSSISGFKRGVTWG